MSEKPKFRDFHRANRHSKFNEDLLYVYERKRGKLALYNKLPLKTRYKYQFIGAGIILAICAPIFVLWFIFWDNVLFLRSTYPEFLFVMFITTQFIGNVIINKLLYARMDFEKISEIDWNDAKESVYEKTNYWKMRFPLVISAGIYFIMVLVIGFTPVYIRYLVDRALGTPWQAVVRIEPNKDSEIRFDDKTLPGKIFIIENYDESKRTTIVISTYRILEMAKLFLNGNEVELDYRDYSSGNAGHFWSDDYFWLVIVDNIYLKIPEGQNTLELRSANFNKKWTFTLEYE